MAEPFAEFIARLSPEARGALLSSIPMLIAAVVGADRVFTGPEELAPDASPLSKLAAMFGLGDEQNEISAAADALVDATLALGEEFRRSPEAQQELDKLAATARAGGPEDLDFKLQFLGEIVGAMPPSLAETYRSFVARTCLSLATASGGGVFTNPVSAVEANVIQKIVKALSLRIDDPVERMLLGMEPDPSDDPG